MEVLQGPQISMWTSWKGTDEWIVLSWNGNLCCLAIGQTVHKNGCLDEILSDKKEIDFILAKGIWPNLWCQNKSLLLATVGGLQVELWITEVSEELKTGAETLLWTELETQGTGVESCGSAGCKKYSPFAALPISRG